MAIFDHQEFAVRFVTAMNNQDQTAFNTLVTPSGAKRICQACELAPRGIGVNVTCPGAITTVVDDSPETRATARAETSPK